jgi:hypothetical protein
MNDLQKLADDLRRAIKQAEQNSAAIREGRRLLEELESKLPPDVGGPYNTGR